MVRLWQEDSEADHFVLFKVGRCVHVRLCSVKYEADSPEFLDRFCGEKNSRRLFLEQRASISDDATDGPSGFSLTYSPCVTSRMCGVYCRIFAEAGVRTA